MVRQSIGMKVSVATVLATAGLALGQGYSTNFEAAAYTGADAGTALQTQDGWYTPPVVGSQAFNVYTYSGNALLFDPNPSGGAQFAGGVGAAAGPARRPGTGAL